MVASLIPGGMVGGLQYSAGKSTDFTKTLSSCWGQAWPREGGVGFVLGGRL